MPAFARDLVILITEVKLIVPSSPLFRASTTKITDALGHVSCVDVVVVVVVVVVVEVSGGGFDVD